MKYMNIMAILLVVSVLAVALKPLISSKLREIREAGFITACNIAGTHVGGDTTRIAEGSGITLRHLIVTAGTDAATQVKVGTAVLEPCGVADDACEAGDRVSVGRLNVTNRTRLMVASKAIAAEARVYTTAGGKVTDTAVNNSWLVGKAITAAAADTDEIEVEPVFPVQQSV